MNTVQTVTTCEKCATAINNDNCLWLESEVFCVRCALQKCAKHYAKNFNSENVQYMRDLADETGMTEYFGALFDYYRGLTELQPLVNSMFNMLNRVMQFNHDLLMTIGIEYVLEYDSTLETDTISGELFILEYNHNTNKTTEICRTTSTQQAYIQYLQSVALNLCDLE